MLTSLLFIVLLRFLAGIMVWVMVALVIIVIGYGTSPKHSFVFVLFAQNRSENRFNKLWDPEQVYSF